MGQLLITIGQDSGAVVDVFQKSTALFGRLNNLMPSDQLTRPTLQVATFPKLCAPTSGIVHAGNAWGCSAGTVFYGNRSGREALKALLLSSDSSNLLDDLDGSYAVVRGSEQDDRLSLLTDRLGTLHVYIAEFDRCTVISTSSLVLAALKRPDWDLLSCQEFLATGTVFEDRTLFIGIRKLQPASLYDFRVHGTPSRTVYWDLKRHLYDRAQSIGDVFHLADSLQSTVARIVQVHPNAVFDLTGGFDSRAVLAAALRGGSPIATVVNGAASDPDVRVANQIADQFGLNHRHQLRPRTDDLWAQANSALSLCDGECDVIEYASTMSSHLTLAKQFGASVNGSNGEVCKGYWWELMFPHIGSRYSFSPELVAKKRFAFESASADILAVPPCNLTEHFTDVIRRANKGLEDYPNTACMDNVYLTLRMQRWQGRIASATNRIWPCVSPFMFREPMEIALSAAPHVRVRHRMTRRLIEHLNPRLAAMPLAQGYPALPLRWNTAHRFGPLAGEGARSVQRRLHRILPIRRKPLAPATGENKLWQHTRELLQPHTMVTRTLYDPTRLNGLIELMNARSFGPSRVSNRILTLELLARAVYC